MSMPIEAKEPDLLIKLILIGDSGVGKTNLLTRFVSDEFNHDSRTTIGVDFRTKTIQWNDRIVKVQIWDTAGQERYRSVTSTYYRGVMGALVVYDITSAQSFQSISKWLRELRSNSDERLVIMLIGNKVDEETQRCVSAKDGEALARSEELLFAEASAKEDTGVSDCFMTMVAEILTVRAGLGPIGGESNQATVSLAGTPIRKEVAFKCC
jgi:Ras-related protein Rab-11A